MCAPSTYTAFIGDKLLKHGGLAEVALAVKAADIPGQPMAMVFDDATGAVVDLDLRGTDENVLARLPRTLGAPKIQSDNEAGKVGRGRPKLGVTAKEITLLPRHWTWLAKQSGGASAAIRRLVEQAAKDTQAADAKREAQTATYKAMHALAGHLGSYEEALRALYAGRPDTFEQLIAEWPSDVRAYVLRLSRQAFE